MKALLLTEGVGFHQWIRRIPELVEADRDWRVRLPALRKLLVRSRLGSAPAEGVYLRWDDRDWLLARAKIVRPGWIIQRGTRASSTATGRPFRGACEPAA